MAKNPPTVWLASYPRSGVTFLRLVLERLYGVQTYSDSKEEWVATGGLFAGRLYPRECSESSWNFVKTHTLPPAWGSMPAIHIVRDPRDAMVSYAHYLKQFNRVYGEHWEVLWRVVCGSCPQGAWAPHTVTWLGRPASRIHFDDLVANPVETVMRAVHDLNIGLEPVAADGVPTFDELKAASPNFFRSGRSGQWKEEFPEHMLERFESLYGAAIRAYEDAFARKIYGERA